MREVKIGGVYRHFKGNIATVITIAKDSETMEDLVIYSCTSLDPNHVNGIYARNKKMFLSEVDHKKYPDIKQKYRFELLEDKEGI